MSDDFGMQNIDKVDVFVRVKKLAKKYGKVTNLEVKKRDPFIPPSIEKSLRESLVKSRAIIANEIATKNDIRISAIKQLLNDMLEEGLLEVVSASSRIKVLKGKGVE